MPFILKGLQLLRRDSRFRVSISFSAIRDEEVEMSVSVQPLMEAEGEAGFTVRPMETRTLTLLAETEASEDISLYFGRGMESLPTRSYRVFMPMLNFESDTIEDERIGGLRLMRTPPSRLEELRFWLESASLLTGLEASSIQFVAEAIYEVSGRTVGFDEAGKWLYEIISTLRIFKPGALSAPYVLLEPVHESKLKYMLVDLPMGRGFPGSSYVLDQDELGDLRRLWRRFRESEVSSIDPLRIAIGNFNKSYGRERMEDGLIDFIKALEAIYLERGERGKRSKLADRVSRFIGISADMISRAYKLRSEIEHGDILEIYDKSGIRIDPAGFVSKMEEATRGSLKKLIEATENTSPYNILKKLRQEFPR